MEMRVHCSIVRLVAYSFPVCMVGVKIVRRQIGPGMVQQLQQACDECAGRGEVRLCCFVTSVGVHTITQFV